MTYCIKMIKPKIHHIVCYEMSLFAYEYNNVKMALKKYFKQIKNTKLKVN
mgnify:CR=1 FL=1